MNNDFDSKEYRDAFVDAMIRNGLAFQIRTLREQHDWTQGLLAGRIGTQQNVISRYEDPDYGSFSLRTLKRLASEFNVALLCRFATFGELRGFAANVSEESVAVLNYDQEIERAAKTTVAANSAASKIITFPSTIGRGTLSRTSGTTEITTSQWWASDGGLLAAEVESRDGVSPRGTTVSASGADEFSAATLDVRYG